MHPTFCTFFDSNYLAKGVTLIRSLSERSSIVPEIYVMPCDHRTARVVNALGFYGVKTIPLWDLEVAEPRLVKAKQSRTAQEYFWTLGSQFANYVMQKFGPPSLTYIDADMMIFSDPGSVFESAMDKSIIITPHNFPDSKKDYEVNGKYCVSWVSWENDPIGRECLSTWAGQCLDWCYYRHENGKFADQKYLDDWPVRYPDRVLVAKDVSIWPAPWNVWAHETGLGPTIDGKKIVAYHFHEFKRSSRWSEGGFSYTGWPIREEDVSAIYLPYVTEYLKSERLIRHVESLPLQ